MLLPLPDLCITTALFSSCSTYIKVQCHNVTLLIFLKFSGAMPGLPYQQVRPTMNCIEAIGKIFQDVYCARIKCDT